MKYKDKFIQIYTNKNFRAKLFFFAAGVFYTLLTYIFFLYDFNKNDYLSERLKYVTYVLKNLERNFNEKNLEIRFQNKEYLINKDEPILLENYDKKISQNKFILYISKNAEDKDFKEKDTFAILNSKEVKVNIEPPLIYLNENFEALMPLVTKSELKNINEKFYVGSESYNSTALNLIIVLKALELFFLLIIGTLLLPYLVYGVLFFSGYKDVKPEFYKNNSLIGIGVFLILKPFLVTFILEPSFMSVLLLITSFVSIKEKNKLEKN